MKIGNLLVNAAYLGERVLTAIAVGATKVWEGVSKYIKFKDPVVEQLCMKWSSDGIGLTPEDAAKVTDIGTTFQGNTEITSFDELGMFTNVQTLLGFRSCTALSSIDLSNIKTIRTFGLAYNPELIYVGDMSNVETIEGAAFIQCTKLKSVNLKKVTIMRNCFLGCSSLEQVGDISSVTSLFNTFSSCANLRSVNLKAITHIEGAFESCHNLTEVGDVSNAVTVGGFRSCSKIKTLNLKAAKTILDFAFFSSGIETFGDTSKVETIGYVAFYGCKLKSITLKAITSIGERAFDACNSLNTIVCNTSTPPSLGSNALRGTSSSLSIYVPDESVEAYKSATNWSAYADRIKPMSEYVEPTNE